VWILGVYDGHGAQGHFVSDFVKRNLISTLSELAEEKQVTLIE